MYELEWKKCPHNQGKRVCRIISIKKLLDNGSDVHGFLRPEYMVAMGKT
ncbi:MAG: hypothetical protein LLF83_10610 [Methanobacterium sp.]|nr:hypothetical protein [Methanobacterium sp.]